LTSQGGSIYLSPVLGTRSDRSGAAARQPQLVSTVLFSHTSLPGSLCSGS
jgi:hypothetical protein